MTVSARTRTQPRYELDSPEVFEMEASAWREGADLARRMERKRIREALVDAERGGVVKLQDVADVLWPPDAASEVD